MPRKIIILREKSEPGTTVPSIIRLVVGTVEKHIMKAYAKKRKRRFPCIPQAT